MSLDKPKALTAVRTRAYGELFGCKPSAVFLPHALFKKPDERFHIDILMYTLETGSGDIDVVVTNGMADQRLADPGHPHEWKRRELIQYLPKCTEGHTRRLHDMAGLPLFDGLYHDGRHSVAWDLPAVAGTTWKNAFFLLPLIKSHREFVFEVEQDKASFLWHVPISDEERACSSASGRTRCSSGSARSRATRRCRKPTSASSKSRAGAP